MGLFYQIWYAEGIKAIVSKSAGFYLWKLLKKANLPFFELREGAVDDFGAGAVGAFGYGKMKE